MPAAVQSESGGPVSRVSRSGPVPVQSETKPKTVRKRGLAREIESLRGTQVTALRESTEYGAGIAVRPIQIRRTIVGDFNTQIQAALREKPLAPSIRTTTGTRRRVGGSSIGTSRDTPQREIPESDDESIPEFDPAAGLIGNGTVKPATTTAIVNGIPSPATTNGSGTEDVKPTTSKKPAKKTTKVAKEGPTVKKEPPEKSVQKKSAAKQQKPQKTQKTLHGGATVESDEESEVESEVESEAEQQTTPLTQRVLGYDAASIKRIKSWWRIYKLLMLWLIVLGLAAWGIYNTDNPINKATGYQVKTALNKIRDLTPYTIAHPVDWMMDPQVQDLKKRMTAAESDIRQLKIDVKRDHEQIETLSRKLPEFVVAKKDKYGKIQIPLEFWQAIKDNILSDKEFTKFASNDSMKSSPVSWKDFERANKANLQKMLADEVKVHRSDIQRALSDDIKNVKAQNIEEIRALRARIEEHYLTKKEQISPSQLKAMIDEAYSRHNSGSRIEAMINDKIRIHQNRSLRNYNFFAPSQGAVIIPTYNSPTYEPNIINWSSSLKTGFGLTGKAAVKPHSHVKALMKWDDVGDCWCAKTSAEKSAQLHIGTPQLFYPDEVVIEHVAPESTMDRGSAPKTMELFIKVGMKKAQDSGIASASDAMFADAPPETELGDDWVRIGRWRYDLMNKQETQVFGLQLKTARYDIKVNEFVLRAVDNWGSPDHTCLYRVRMHGKVENEEKIVREEGGI